VSFTARNHPQQIERRGALGDVDDRRTPPDLLAECLTIAGLDAVDLDAAATDANTVTARYCRDGLAEPWSGRVWVNPPYSACEAWVRKAHEERHRCERIVMLLPANRTEQRWWQDLVEPYRLQEPRRLAGKPLEVYFLARRRRFDRPGWTIPTKGDRPPFGLVVVVMVGEGLMCGSTASRAPTTAPADAWFRTDELTERHT
jgi:hypothetical protein